MSEEVTLVEAHRIMTICNACRYCEGFCAVWPAMELHRSFKDSDLKYFANLCHNCRGCYYACQYAPPHEFKLNAPQTLARLRKETYAEFAWPRPLARLFVNNGLVVFLVGLLGVILFMTGAISSYGIENFFAVHTGEGAFYKIVPYWLMLVLFSAVMLFSILSIINGVRAMWRITGSNAVSFGVKDHVQAIRDAFSLRYLDGGGDGCNYPDARFGFSRRNCHHLTFYGFVACLASTGVAFIYDHGFGWPAPYGVFSLPVILGTVGGIGLCCGTGGLAFLKCVMDREPHDESSTGMDMSFTVLLFLVSLSGLMLLLLRSSSLMGLLLCVHLGLVLGFFLTLPYGKFIHAVYRYAALVRNAYEQREGRAL